MKPNLFALATKELSQDAFITWLLQWADSKCRELNPALNAVASEFVNRLISLQSTPPEQLSRVKAGRQWESIDVWAEVNDSHLIVIEDKTGSGQHSDQLARYRKTGEEWCRQNKCELICVYIKTYSDSSLNLKKVAEQGFAVFNRRELLELLNAHEIGSDIYNDFRDRLRELEGNESSFLEKRIGEWKADQWKGLYQQIERSRGLVNWGYVPNPSGGFWNAVLNWLKCDGVNPYMQIEQGNLCLKVGEVYENRRAVRERFHHLLMEGALPEMRLERPSRFGSGNFMTVAIIPRSAWLGSDDEILHIDAVIARLNRYESWFVGVIESAQNSAAAI